MFHKKKSFFLILFCFLSLSLFLTACGPKKEKVYNIGVLLGLDSFAPNIESFRQQMTVLGYVDGRNAIYDVQKSGFNPEKEKQIIQNFVDQKVDLIVATPTEASISAKQGAEGTGVPVVFIDSNIEGTNLVKSVQEPGGNITGVRYPGPDLAIKALEMTLQLFPDTKKIAIPYLSGYPISASQLLVLGDIVPDKGVELVEMPAESAEDVISQFEALDKEDNPGFDVIMHISGPLPMNKDVIVAIGKFADKRSIPVVNSTVEVDGYSGLFSLLTNKSATGKQAAYLADKVLKGVPAGTIPLVSSETYLKVNYAAAQKRGIEIPETFLGMADEIVK